MILHRSSNGAAVILESDDGRSVDLGGRASGKSIRAIEWAADNPERVVVTFHAASVQYLRDEAKEMGVAIEVVSWDQYIQGVLRGRRPVEVYIDEVGLCLDSLGGKVVGMSGLG